MLNIFFVIHNFSGATTYCYQLAKYLSQKKGLTIYIILLESELYSEFTVVTTEKINSIYIPKNAIKKFDIRYYDRAALLVYANFKMVRNVIFHINTQDQFLFAQRIKELFACKVVFTLHFLKPVYSFIDKTKHLANFSEDILFNQTIELADHIICVTSFAQRTLDKLFNVELLKTSVILNGMTLLAKESPYKSLGKCDYGFEAEDRLILYAGQLEERKGIDKLIEAFITIKNKFPKAKLIISGSGDFNTYFSLAQKCIGRIFFTGNLDKNSLFNFYKFCEIGVIPSQFEQCSYVAIEMMQHKLPLVISDVPGLNELVIHGKTGLICRTQQNKTKLNTLEADERDLAENLEYLLENPEKSKRLSYQAYQSYLENHNLKSMGEKTINIYHQLMRIENNNKTSI